MPIINLATDTRADAVLGAIVAGPRAWSTAAALERDHGRRAVRRLAEAGWLAAWAVARDGHRLRARSWTLTPWAAELLGLVVDELPDPDGCGVPVWVRAGAESTAVAVRQCARRLGCPHLVPNPFDRGPAYATDDDDEPVLLWGAAIPIDPRLGPRRPRQGRRRSVR